jgi:hypothetical protein
MRLKIIVVFVAVFLSFGYSNAVGTDHKPPKIKFVTEFEMENAETVREKPFELALENGSTVNCLFEAKNSTVQNAGHGKLSVAVKSNWICQ